ncbi:MAG: molybdopterin-dependent oxidoreductase [Pseudomonadales bacterium]|nr:molybdopterin-dependent oxidoreductase [Pseudomonadales bacterium]
MVEKKPTFCRVCEPSCGLVAAVEDNHIIGLKPDKSHPVTAGFACHKGIKSLAIHQDPDRVNSPQKRKFPDSRQAAEAQFDFLSWDLAATEIAEKLKAIQGKWGSSAIAVYIGNPTAFNSTFTPALTSFMLQLGIRKVFTSGTQDCMNKFAAAEGVYGTSTLHPVPDIEHTDYLLVLGENPKISHMSFLSIADPMKKIKGITQRGGKVRYVNPRIIESANKKSDEVIQIKPDTDLYFLAAVLNHIHNEQGFDQQTLLAHANHSEGLIDFISDYTPERVSDVVGIPAEKIKQVAMEFSSAKRAAVHMSTGVNMGRQGTLCYWLVQMLSLVTGNLDKQGGNLYSLGFYPAAKAGRIKLDNLFFNSSVGELRLVRGALPGNLLPDFIEDDTDPIKALLVFAGNPILSMAGESRQREAFKQLDLLVSVDLYRNATGELADYVLPAADMLERSDINICGLGMQSQPFVQYTDAVVEPHYERKEDWWILAKLEQAYGVNSVLDKPDYNVHERNNKMLAYSGLSIEKLKQSPSQAIALAPLTAGKFFSDWIQTEDKRVDCYPTIFAEAIEQSTRIFDELRAEPEHQLKLISLRTNYMQNSWYHNLPDLKREHQQFNAVYMAPEDFDRAHLMDGQEVKVSSNYGSIKAQVRLDVGLRSGVVAMTHGWGNARTTGMKIAQRYPGSNVNELLPSGSGSYEKISNQAFMTGIPVSISTLD